MNIDFRSIVIYLHKKGLTPYEIQSEIDSVFGENSYSYQAITKTIRATSFTPSQNGNEKFEDKFLHQQRIQIIKKILEDFPFSSLREIAQEGHIPKTIIYRIIRTDLRYVVNHLRWIPHILTCSQKVSRINLSKIL